MEPVTSEFVEVRDSDIHNKGVFAARDIPKGTKVIQYVGEKITKKQSEDRVTQTIENADRENGAVYIFELNKKYDIDGKVAYNTARFINHSCEPNCETEIINNKIWIVALRKIRQGEELSYNYGYDLDEFEDHPCNCGAGKCMGYIAAEEHWPKLRRILKKRKSG